MPGVHIYQGASMSLLKELDLRISANGGLIVSCQPVPGSPLDKPEIVAYNRASKAVDRASAAAYKTHVR